MAMTDHTGHLKKETCSVPKFQICFVYAVTNQLINNSAASLGQRQLIQKFDHGYNCFNKKECIRIGSYLLLSLPDVAPELSELT